MRRTGPELLEEMSESARVPARPRRSPPAWRCSSRRSRPASTPATSRVDDPTLLANTLYASGLGALQLARVGILVKESAPGIPTVGTVSPEQVRDYLVATALALATR